MQLAKSTSSHVADGCSNGYESPESKPPRLLWVNREARNSWEKRQRRIRYSCDQIQWQSITCGIRRCAALLVSVESYPHASIVWSRRGLVSIPLELTGKSGEAMGINDPARQGCMYRIVVGRSADVFEFRDAWQACDEAALAERLRVPTCCHQSYRSLTVEKGLFDTTWKMIGHRNSGVQRGIAEIRCDPMCNVLWRWLGVRATPHLPCGFDCKPTSELGRAYYDCGVEEGYREEMEWLTELLGWPAEWASVFGIAEIRTPIHKMLVATDLCTEKRAIRLISDTYPPEGGRGNVYPYSLGNSRTSRGVTQVAARVSDGRSDLNERNYRKSNPGRFPWQVEDVQEQRVGNYFVIGVSGSGRIGLNESAKSIWDLCDGTKTAEDISSLLERRHSVPRDSLGDDVKSTIVKLQRSFLVTTESDPLISSGGAVEWRRLVRPQDDGYDTSFYEAVNARRLRLLRGIGDVSSVPKVCNGSVAVKYCYPSRDPEVIDAPLDHENIKGSEQYLRIWPAMARQCEKLIKIVHPMLIRNERQSTSAIVTGCRSHSEELMPGTFFTTVNCPFLTAIDFVHELGHQKLFSLGIHKEEASRFVLNDRSELFHSPFRPQPRPLPAVLHGVYSFAHVTELSIRVLSASAVSEEIGARVVSRIQRDVPRLQVGIETIKSGATLDAAGRELVEALDSWIKDLEGEARNCGAI